MLKEISNDVVLLANYVQTIKKELKQFKAERKRMLDLFEEKEINFNDEEESSELELGSKVCFVDDATVAGKIVKFSEHSVWVKVPWKKEPCIKRRHKVRRI